MPSQNVNAPVIGRSLIQEPQMWMSVIGPVLMHLKSSASIHGPLFHTSSPPKSFGPCTYLTPLVSTQPVGGGVLVAVVILNARSSGPPVEACWVFVQGAPTGGGEPGHGA